MCLEMTEVIDSGMKFTSPTQYFVKVNERERKEGNEMIHHGMTHASGREKKEDKIKESLR